MSIDSIKLNSRGIFQKYYVKFAGVFGSQAKGTADTQSDTDFLVEFEKTPSLINLIRFEHELADALNTKVDVVISGTEKKFIKPEIEKYLIPIYGQR